MSSVPFYFGKHMYTTTLLLDVSPFTIVTHALICVC